VQPRKPWAGRRAFSMRPLMASVLPLETPKVSKWASRLVRHARRVRPSLGNGQVQNEASTSSAMRPLDSRCGRGRSSAAAGSTVIASWLDCHQQYLDRNRTGTAALGGTGISCPVGVVKSSES
jgi:hypothetical protein